MGRLTLFSYKSSNSFLHNLDTRCKLIVLSFLSISILKADFTALIIITIIILGFLASEDIKLISLLKQIKYFILLLFFIFIARAVSTNGDSLFVLSWISFTKQGVIEGVRVCWKFFIIMVMGILFSCSTKPSYLKCAAQWFLRPIPFIPEKRISIMISLFLRFFPLILKQVNNVLDAQKTRCSELQKNPIKKIINVSLPVLKKIFQCADNLAISMEARCYSENRTEPEFIKSGQEKNVYIATIVLSSIMFAF